MDYFFYNAVFVNFVFVWSKEAWGNLSIRIIIIFTGFYKLYILLWITISFIIIGFIVLIFSKKDMESKVAFIKANEENEESLSKAKSVIWWVRSVAAFGVVSIFLVVWCFQNAF